MSREPDPTLLDVILVLWSAFALAVWIAVVSGYPAPAAGGWLWIIVTGAVAAAGTVRMFQSRRGRR